MRIRRSISLCMRAAALCCMYGCLIANSAKLKRTQKLLIHVYVHMYIQHLRPQKC